MKRSLIIASLLSLSTFLSIAQPPAEGDYSRPSQDDTTGPKGNRTLSGGRRVLRADSAENADKVTQKQAQQNNKAHNGNKQNKRNSANAKSKE